MNKLHQISQVGQNHVYKKIEKWREFFNFWESQKSNNKQIKNNHSLHNSEVLLFEKLRGSCKVASYPNRSIFNFEH